MIKSCDSLAAAAASAAFPNNAKLHPSLHKNSFFARPAAYSGCPKPVLQSNRPADRAALAHDSNAACLDEPSVMLASRVMLFAFRNSLHPLTQCKDGLWGLTPRFLQISI